MANLGNDHSPFIEVAKLHSDIFINTVENICRKKERPASIILQCSDIPALYSLRHKN